MTKLEYTFTNDMLFKMVFVKYPELLKRLVAQILGIQLSNIGRFVITNPEIAPEFMGDKFCRLDITMTLDDQRIALEIQVSNEGDYPERSLYYWAREYSSALAEGGDYSDIPRTIIINIVAFKLFECEEYHSEFQALEVKRHTPLTDKMGMFYFELPKLPEVISSEDELKLWLLLFKAKTEEELNQIEALGVPIMEQAIEAYRHISSTDEFKELERQRSRARHNEAAALRHATEIERKKWQQVVAEKDAVLADKDITLAEKETLIADKDVALAGKDTLIADKDAALADKDIALAEKETLIAELKAKLDGRF
jgi:predicted transposase/invertase (TIGR01784 family)